MLNGGVVGGSVESNEESPAAPVTVVLVALVQYITVEEESIPRVQLNLDQREDLVCVCMCVCIHVCVSNIGLGLGRVRY